MRLPAIERSAWRAYPQATEDCHGIRPRRQERHDRRWVRTAALSRRCRRQGWQDRRDRPHQRRGDGRDAGRRGPCRDAGLRRRAHAHGRADLLGSDRHQLVLPRRDQRGHGQLRLHPGAVPRERGRPRHAQSRARRGHQPRRHEGRHQVALGDLPRIPRRARQPAQGHQLLGLYRPLRLAHLRDGRARLHRRGDRGRDHDHGASRQGGDQGGRLRLLLDALHQPHDLGRQAGGEPPRDLARARDDGAGHGRARFGHPGDRRRPLGHRQRDRREVL